MAKQITLFETTNRASGELASGIGASTTTISLKAGEGAEFPQPITGAATSGGDIITLNSTGIQAAGVVVGDFIKNITDGSHAWVLSISANQVITTPLRAGTGNTWDNTDTWAVNQFIISLNIKDANGDITAIEMAQIEDRSSDILTVAAGGRGFGNTTATAWNADDNVELFVVAENVSEIIKSLGDLAESKSDITHAADHIHNGSDEIDGDTLDITFAPTNYSRTTSPSEVTSVEELTAHLAGIDDFLGGVPSTTRLFTLFEDLTIGDVVKVVDDTGPEIAKIDLVAEFIASGTYTAASTSDTFITYDENVDRFVISYRDLGNSNFGTAIVGQLNDDGTMTFGTEAVFVSASVEDTRAAFDSTNNKVVIAYQNASTVRPFAVVATPTAGLSISFGTPVQVDGTASASRPQAMAIEFDANAGKMLVLYGYTGIGSLRGVVGTVSGTAISFGTGVQYQGQGLAAHCALSYDSTAQKLLIITNDNAGAGQSYVATISGTAVSFTSAVAIQASSDLSSAYGKDIAYDPSANAHLAVYYNTNTVKYQGAVGVISGGAVTWGTAFDLADPTGAEEVIACAFNNQKDYFMVCQGFTTKNTYQTASIVGASVKTARISPEKDATDNVDNPDMAMAYDPDQDRFVISAYIQTGGNFGIFEVSKGGADANLSIGILQETGVAGNSKNVVLYGGISDIHSGLTIGATYYAQADSSLGTPETDFPVGIALSATEILTFKTTKVFT